MKFYQKFTDKMLIITTRLCAVQQVVVYSFFDPAAYFFSCLFQPIGYFVTSSSGTYLFR